MMRTSSVYSEVKEGDWRDEKDEKKHGREAGMKQGTETQILTKF